MSQVTQAQAYQGLPNSIQSNFVYDGIGELTQRSDVDSALTSTFVQTYTYDSAGQRTAIQNPNGSRVTYSYDSDSRASALIGTDGNRTTFQYDSRGFRTTTVYDYSAGVVRNQVYTFDSNGRNTVIRDTSSAGNYCVQTYTCDNNGNRTNVLDLNGSNSTYTYDNKDRLTLDVTSGTNAHTYTYTYDSRDNITLNTETGARVTMSYDVASRLTTSISGSAVTTYTYDANGNLNNVAMGSFGSNMAYNGENQMVSYEDIGASNTQSFRYSAGGLKTVETTDFDENILVWDGDDYDGEYRVSSGVSPGEVSKVYDRVGNIMLGENNSSSSSTQYVTDFLGSVVNQVSGSTGTIIDTFRYKPYGASLQGNPGPFTFAWTGNTGSRTTGLTYSEQYNRARHYSSTTSQWTTRDPLWPEEAAYGYVLGNPVLLNDPYGFKPQKGDPCEKFYHTGPPQIGPPNKLDTPCGTLHFPPNLKVPPKNNDVDAWLCFLQTVSRSLNAKDCYQSILPAMGSFSQLLFEYERNSGLHESDKLIHCVIGCTVSELKSPCCAFYWAIQMEVSFVKRIGKLLQGIDYDPNKQDFYATWKGIECKPGPIKCKGILPALHDFVDPCLSCCEKMYKKGELPFENPRPSK